MSKNATVAGKSRKPTGSRAAARPRRAASHQLRFVVFQEGEWVAAQCLEYDIATQARTLDDLVHEVQRIIVGHIATSRKFHKRPFDGVPEAPRKFWDMFEKSKIPLPAPEAAFNLRYRLKPQLRVAV